MDELLATAIIRTSFGLNGELKISAFNDDTSHFKKLDEVEVRTKDGSRKIYHVEGFHERGSQALLKLREINSPEEGKKLAGALVYVPRQMCAPLMEGEFYVVDLIHCTLVSDGVQLATVVDAFDGPQSLLLEVEDGTGKKCLVPYMEQYIGHVDIEARTIELKAPWLLV